MMKCHFCGKELPEDGNMILYGKGMLHATDPELPPYAACFTCLKSHKLKLCKIERTE